MGKIDNFVHDSLIVYANGEVLPQPYEGQKMSILKLNIFNMQSKKLKNN